MPGSTRTFRYTLQAATGEGHEALANRARKVLGWACEGDKRIVCHGVEGDALGVVQINMTITGRDRWWTRQLAQDILNMVTWGLENPAQLELFSKSIEPHDHRGYAHGRVKTWRERQSA